MNLEQYNALCEACDQLLMAPDSSNERVATPWLHVIRAHPIFLDGYREVFAQQVGTEGKRHIRNFASAMRQLGKALASGGPLWSSVGELPQRSDVLIVSHLVNEFFPAQEGDFYFGKVAGELAEQGISATIALINYTETSPTALARSWRQAKIPRVIFASVLSLTAEWALFRRARAEARRLKSFAVTQANDLTSRIAMRASQEAASGGAVSALRLGEQIKALVVRLQPLAIVVTYEGHSWERIAFASARAVSPQICCIGYQHAALFNLQHAVQRRLSSSYNPDAILTPGSVSQSQLQKNPQLNGVLIDVLGSNRSFLRQTERLWRTANGGRSACLVLPEGILSECNLLFGFSLQCARRMPDIEFIWRLHPNMNYDLLIRQNPVFRQLPANIILSAQTLAEDIARSHWALYRGSTAVVQAAVSGVRPVYLHQIGEIPIDTLYEIGRLHAQVVEPDDFAALVARAGADDARDEAGQVQDYCAQMFTPMSAHALAAFIYGKQKSTSEVV